ncbi:MAG: hypothetical protein R2882_12860 [Gemmatimonadales bacterium]
MPIDSVVLAVPRSIGLGTGLKLGLAPDGYVLLDDSFRIYSFSKSGSLRRAFLARPDGPPAEGAANGPELLPGDSLVAVHDWSRDALNVYRLATGELVHAVRAPARWLGRAWSWRGDTAWFGLGLDKHLIGQWAVGDDSLVTLADTPRRLLSQPSLYLLSGTPRIQAGDSGAVVLPAGLSEVWKIGRTGEVVQRMSIPVARRFGAPPDLFQRQLKARQSQGLTFQPRVSTPELLRRLTSGELLAAYLDFDRIVSDSIRDPWGRFGRYRLYVSLLASDLTRVCLDAELRPDSDLHPSAAMLGDTLALIARRDSTGVEERILVRRYTVSGNGCDWVPAPAG